MEDAILPNIGSGHKRRLLLFNRTHGIEDSYPPNPPEYLYICGILLKMASL